MGGRERERNRKRGRERERLLEVFIEYEVDSYYIDK